MEKLVMCKHMIEVLNENPTNLKNLHQVKSHTDAEKVYFVDFTQYPENPFCDCPHWRYRLAKQLLTVNEAKTL